MARKLTKSSDHCRNLITIVEDLNLSLDNKEEAIREDSSATPDEREADLALVDRQRKAFKRWTAWWEADIARNELKEMAAQAPSAESK